MILDNLNFLTQAIFAPILVVVIVLAVMLSNLDTSLSQTAVEPQAFPPTSDASLVMDL